MEKNTADQTEHLSAVAHFGAQQQEAAERVRAHVLMARMTGASWVQIGKALGISKQTAHARYGKDEAETPSKISDPDVAGTSETPSIFSDAPAPAPRTTARQKAVAAEVQSIRTEIQQIAVKKRQAATGTTGATYRPRHAIANPDTTAQPGIGKGHPHACPGCGDTNHKTEHRDVAAFTAECVPTQYDPPKIAALITQENTK